MPVYVYKCLKCSNVIEVNHGMLESYNGSCVRCDHNELKKIIVSGDFLLKGDGWYRDGYANKDQSREDK